MKYLPLILIISLCSCYTTNRATRQMIRAQVRHPEVVSDYCASVYPPKIDTFERISYKQGEDILHYDTVKIDCDSVIKSDVKIIRVPVLKERIRIDTVSKEVIQTVENTAKVAEVNLLNDKLRQDNANLQDKAERLQTSKRYLLIGCIALAAIIFIPIIIKKIIPIL